MAGESNYNRYADLDLDFIAHPVSGDVVQKLGADAVKRSVRNLIYMRKYEKPFQPDIFSNVRNLLFEPDTPVVKIKLKKSITSLLKKYEPRIRVVAVVVNSDSERQYYNISVGYNIINLPGTQSVSVKLERLR